MRGFCVFSPHNPDTEGDWEMPGRTNVLVAALSLGWSVFADGARAATPEAWAAMRAEVEAACVRAAEPLIESPRARVDPFGSEHFGLALIEGKARGGDGEVAAICVFDKQARTVEIGGELPAAGRGSGASGPLGWTALFEPCGEGCRALFDELAPADADALRELPARVAGTIEAVAAGDISAWPPRAQSALALIRGIDPTPAIALDPGERAVLWYGFLDEGGEEVGRHRCRIHEADGELRLTKLTGEGRTVRLVEFGPGTAAIGRTYLPEQRERRYDPGRPNNRGNENFGNIVGLAFAAERGGLAVVSADMHGFTEPDATFFEVLLVE